MINKKLTADSVVVIDRKRCLTWSTGIVCDLCSYKCPENAIDTTADRKPLIIGQKCKGCGTCYEICPTDPKAMKLEGYINKPQEGGNYE